MLRWRIARDKVWVLQTKKEEKEAVTDKDEEKFWSAGLFGSETAK